jgi:benzoyl-CoA reductase/2-hydroxyglutaryl-CoA dehydratase subunit BcrC/BadD/HgdB
MTKQSSQIPAQQERPEGARGTGIRDQEGLFTRLEELSSIILALPDRMSDAEVEGLLRVLPPDTARSIRSAFSPHVRDVSVPFLKMISGYVKEIRRAREEGRKVILIPFNFPPEVIRLFDNAVPFTCEVITTLAVIALEGQGERYWDQATSLGLPDFLCSSSTIALGSILSGRDFQPDAIVQSTAGACDANSKIHEFVSLEMGIPQFFIEKPTDTSSRGRAHHRRYFRHFLSQLEEFIGEKLDEERMRRVLGEANTAADLYYDFHDLHKFSPCPVPNLFAVYNYGTRFTVWGTPRAVQLMRAMVDLSRRRLDQGAYPAEEEVARCLWLYVGYYFDIWGLFTWMEERGITYLYDALSLYQPLHIDTTSKETMIDSLAEAVFDYPMTRQMGADSMTVTWTEDMIHFIQELNANCAIYSGHHACKQTWSVISKVQSEITRRTGVPVLCLQGDSWNRQITPVGVLQEELSSFIEGVVARKRRRSRRRRRRST